MSGKILAVDYGRVRIGLAVSDPDRKFAFPLLVYVPQKPGCGGVALLPESQPDSDGAFFRKLVREERIAALVVGLPVRTSGEEDQMAREVRRFSAWLTSVTGLPVVHFDERFTSVLAESLLWEAGLTHAKRKQRRDKVAAQILLQTYLEAGCPPESAAGPLETPS
ncbi:MAG: Holliday junction resolvase RuvX [Planctomycetia bacterium]|nr:Holliday junction resolvase RuvX [Planctomycetia bacterium]